MGQKAAPNADTTAGIKFISEENPLKLTENDIRVLREDLKEATEIDFIRFIRTAERTGLDPMSRQIYARLQSEKVKATQTHAEYWKKTLVIITGIDGLRSTAERTGQYRGQTAPEWFYTQDGKSEWRDVFLPTRTGKRDPIGLPDAARVGVYRDGFPQPVYGVANFESFAVYGRGDGAPALTLFWRKMPEHMIAKVAEAQALRKAFPLVIGDLYISEEINTMTEEEQAEVAEALAAARGESAKTATAPAKAAAAPPKPAAAPAPVVTAPEPAAAPPAPVQQAPEPEQQAKPAARPPAPPKAEAAPTPAAKAPEPEQGPFGEAPTPAPAPAPKPAAAPPQSDADPLEYTLQGVTHPHFKGKQLFQLNDNELLRLKEKWLDDPQFKENIDNDPQKSEDRKNILAAIAIRIK